MAKSRTLKRRRKPYNRPNKYHDALCDRLNSSAEGFTLFQIGRMTRCNPETVRRYMLNGRVPAYFVAAFADAFEVSPAWLLTGKGKMRGR